MNVPQISDRYTQQIIEEWIKEGENMFQAGQILYYKNYECKVTHILPKYKHGNNAYLVRFIKYRGMINISKLCYEDELIDPVQISLWG